MLADVFKAIFSAKYPSMPAYSYIGLLGTHSTRCIPQPVIRKCTKPTPTVNGAGQGGKILEPSTVSVNAFSVQLIFFRRIHASSYLLYGVQCTYLALGWRLETHLAKYLPRYDPF